VETIVAGKLKVSSERAWRHDRNWKDKFIGKRIAPHLENYRWHIFSFHGDKVEGEKATNEI